jgi:hypothetical protein
MLGRNCLFVRFFAWLTLLPNPRVLPQTSQCAITDSFDGHPASKYNPIGTLAYRKRGRKDQAIAYIKSMIRMHNRWKPLTGSIL